MAKYWYFAKCDKCKEVKHILVSNPSCSTHYLDDVEVQGWLIKHYACELTLGWRDDHLNQLWDEGYLNNDLT